MTTRCAAKPGAQTRAALDSLATFGVAAGEKIAVADIMAVRRDGAASSGGISEAACRGCSCRCRTAAITAAPSASFPMAAAIRARCRWARWSAQVRALVERGHAEIVLTGVDLTSYGADLPGAPKLGQLTKQILRHVPELKRLRISSIDSIEVDRDLLDVIADDERLMPHLHLSLQSGDDLILKRMKRRHSRQRRDRVLRAGAAAAAGHRARRRYHRGLPDRDRGDVRALAGSGRGMRSDLPARVSLFAAPGHAGGAHAAGRGRRRSRSARDACARPARPRCSGGSRRRSARRARF